VRHSKIGCPTSGLVKMRRTRIEHILSAFLVRFTPVSDRRADIRNRQLRANRDLTHRSKKHRYSITSSARSKNVSGIVRPSQFDHTAL
jgi:hypothetical protein